MKDDDLKKILRQSLQQTAIKDDEKHLAVVFLLAKAEAGRRAKKPRISFLRFLFLQIKFMGWKIWTAQGIFLWVLSNLLRHWWRYLLENPSGITRALFCLAVLVLMTALPFIYRSVFYQMQEIETATYFSSAKLLMARLAIIGFGSVVILGGIFAGIVIKTSLPASNVFLWLAVPFLFIAGGSLFMLGHFGNKGFFYGSMSLCIFSILSCIALPERYHQLFQQSYSLNWLMAGIFLILFCVGQLRYILYHSAYAEKQIV